MEKVTIDFSNGPDQELTQKLRLTLMRFGMCDRKQIDAVVTHIAGRIRENPNQVTVSHHSPQDPRAYLNPHTAQCSVHYLSTRGYWLEVHAPESQTYQGKG